MSGTELGKSTSSTETSGETDWEAQVRVLDDRIKGLQTALNRKDEEAKQALQSKDSTIANMTQEAQKLQSSMKTFEDQLKSLQDQMGNVAKERDAVKSLAATKDKELARFKVVAKHPDLLEDYEAGRLRTDLEGEEFEKHVDDWANRLQAAVTGKITRLTRTATPSTGSTRQVPVGEDQLMDQLRKAKPEELDSLYDQLCKQ